MLVSQSTPAATVPAIVPSTPANDSQLLRVGLFLPQRLDGAAYTALFDVLPGVKVVYSATGFAISRVELQSIATEALIIDQRLMGETQLMNLRALLEENLLRVVIMLADPGMALRVPVQHERFHECGRHEKVARLTQLLMAAAASKTTDAGMEHHNFDLNLAELTRRTRITTRERQVWRHIAEGRSVRQTAEQMELAESTIESHKTRLMKKLEVRKSVELVRLAVRFGIVDA